MKQRYPNIELPSLLKKELDALVKEQEDKGRPVKVVRTYVRTSPRGVEYWTAQVESLVPETLGRKRVWRRYTKWRTS